MGLGFAAGCSSSSPSGGPTAANDAAPSSGDDAMSSSVDSGGSPAVQDAAPMVCDAVSLAAPADSGAPACFACIAAQCMSQVAACSMDCSCAPAYACLEMSSTGGSINSGYSACPSAVDTVMSGNAALTALTDCASPNCSSQCFGDGG
jgi:hypothetical protein